MPLVRAQALVLRSFRFSETSKIVRLYTDLFGLQSVIAKGALRPRSRFGAALETFTHLSCIYYRKAPGALGTLSQADILQSFPSLRTDLRRFAVAGVIAETLGRFASEDAAAPDLFALGLSSLREAASRPPGDLGRLLLAYQWRLAAVMGFRPTLEACALCGQTLPASAEAPFDPQAGGCVCHRCAGHAVQPVRCTPTLRAALGALLEGQVEGGGLLPEEERALTVLAGQFLAYHTEDPRPLRSWELWAAVAEEPAR